jgi:DNA-binding beta-propeller fold protein YncE
VSTLAGTAGASGTTNATGSSARFSSPSGIAYDNTNDNVYIVDRGNHSIRKMTSSYVVSTLAATSGTAGFADGSTTAAKFQNPEKLVYDARSGSLYVADTNNHAIRKVTTAGVVTIFAGFGYATSIDGAMIDSRINAPKGIAVDTDGNFYIAETGAHKIRKITVNTQGSIGGGGGAGGSGLKEVQFR